MGIAEFQLTFQFAFFAVPNLKLGTRPKGGSPKDKSEI